jgi:hypothetical protein
MSNTNQQISADKAPESPPEKTYTQAEYERVDKNRREVQKKLDAVQKQFVELQDSYDTTLADNKALGVTLEEAYDDEKLKAAIKDHTQAVAKHNKERLALKKEREAFDGIVSETASQKLEGMRQRLATEYGVAVDTLMEFTDPDKMELYAFKNRTVKEPLAQGQVNKEPDMPIVPSGKVGGDSWRDLPPDEKMRLGVKELFQKK